MNNNSNGISGCRPVLRVDSVARSLVYYADLLGFHVGWVWSNVEQRFLRPGDTAAPGFALVGRGNVQFMLSEKSQGAPGMWIHLDVDSADNIDSLYAEWTRKGARVAEPPSIRAWGMYEMRIQDLDGHTFRVSAPPRAAS